MGRGAIKAIAAMRAGNSDLPQWRPPQNIKHAATVISELGRNLHEHAYIVGRTLLWVKKELGHGQFLPWLEKNIWFGRMTASRMMRFAVRCEKEGQTVEYHPRSNTVIHLPAPRRKPAKQSESGPFPPESECYFDIAHRLNHTYPDLSRDDQVQLIARLRALLDILEKGETIHL